nr:coiled-coil domain-containing protein 174 isoform X2 [Halyomorpha halys]
MKSGKTIDISKSSLISLKAELSRKQEEVKNIKTTNSYIKLPPKPKVPVKKNIGVEDRNKRDTELDSEEIDLLKKSKEVLAVKSKLYDEIQKGNIVPSDEKQQVYLVDFKNKETTDFPSSSSDLKSNPVIVLDENDTDADDYPVDTEDIDDNEWVEYTDCLGRTRKCHRSDLPAMKEIDRKMGQEVKDRNPDVIKEEVTRDRPPELVSSDMEREMFRKKWEEQERELQKKTDIHYEDVLFDELLRVSEPNALVIVRYTWSTSPSPSC